jgi:hypothetical protein
MSRHDTQRGAVTARRNAITLFVRSVLFADLDRYQTRLDSSVHKQSGSGSRWNCWTPAREIQSVVLKGMSRVEDCNQVVPFLSGLSSCCCMLVVDCTFVPSCCRVVVARRTLGCLTLPVSGSDSGFCCNRQALQTGQQHESPSM